MMLPWTTGKEGKCSATAVRDGTNFSGTARSMARYPRLVAAVFHGWAQPKDFVEMTQGPMGAVRNKVKSG